MAQALSKGRPCTSISRRISSATCTRVKEYWGRLSEGRKKQQQVRCSNAAVAKLVQATGWQTAAMLTAPHRNGGVRVVHLEARLVGQARQVAVLLLQAAGSRGDGSGWDRLDMGSRSPPGSSPSTSAYPRHIPLQAHAHSSAALYTLHAPLNSHPTTPPPHTR